MIVVDSSIWIARLRGQDSARTAIVDRLVGHEPLVLGDLVLAEVLQGARDDLHAARIERELRRFSIVAMVTPDLAIAAARNDRLLRQRGVTVRRTIDMLIATFCLTRGWPLLHQDRDFDALEQHLGLPVLHG